MKPAEYFERYAPESHLEFFRGEDLPAGVPARPGIYAWYGRVVISTPDREKASTTGGLDALLRDQVFDRYQRQPYDVTLSASLEPRFRGRVVHEPESPSTSGWAAEATARATGTMFAFLARSFAPAMSAPIYVGKAVKQPLSTRIAQHMTGLREYQGRTPEYLEEQRQTLVGTRVEADDEEADAHSFAIEAAARHFSPARLLLVTYAPPALPAGDIDLLEYVVNRISYPICGRR